MNVLDKLAIWWLRRRRVSVIIGADISGQGVKAAHIYDTAFRDLDFSHTRPFGVLRIDPP